MQACMEIEFGFQIPLQVLHTSLLLLVAWNISLSLFSCLHCQYPSEDSKDGKMLWKILKIVKFSLGVQLLPVKTVYWIFHASELAEKWIHDWKK